MVTLDSALALLPRAELFAMQKDGEVSFIANQALVADVCLTPEVKSRLVCLTDPDRLILCGYSALWAAGLCAEPRRHEVLLRPGKRPRNATEDTHTVRELRVAHGDVIHASDGTARLTPERALCDALRLDSRDDDRVAQECADIMQRANISVASMRRRLTQSEATSYRNRALMRLAFIDAINVIDAVDTTHRVENTLEVASIPGFEDKTTQGETL